MALVLSDIHLPFHDKNAVMAALEAGVSAGMTDIILNGDTLDCYSISTHDKNPSLTDFQYEISQGKQFLQLLREGFPDIRIWMKEGNHENRLERLLMKKAPELLGLPSFSWESILDLSVADVTFVEGHRHFNLSGITVWHGHEFRGSGGVYPARWLHLKTGGLNAMCGHFHRSSSYGDRDASGKHHTSYSLGCLCDLAPKYMPVNKWVLGFAIVKHDGNTFDVENFKIINGSIVQ